MSLSDLELLRACIQGKRTAWDELVQRFSPYVYYLIRLTWRRCGVQPSFEDLADAHNDLFLALLEDDRRRLCAYRGDRGCSVRSWIRVITIRRTLDSLRKRRIHFPLEAKNLPEQISEEPDPLSALLMHANEQRRAQLGQLSAKLREEDQALLEMLYTQGLSAKAVAAALKISRGALYTRKNRLLQKLRVLAQEEIQ